MRAQNFSRICCVLLTLSARQGRKKLAASTPIGKGRSSSTPGS